MFQPGFEPINLEYNTNEEFSRFGYISCQDGDKLSYAKQASEGSFIILNSIIFIKVRHVRGIIPKEANSNAILFGITEGEELKLVKWTSLAKTTWSRNLRVQFELKHSYFEGLHSALDNISQEVILKIMPTSKSFVDENKNYWNPGRLDLQTLDLDFYQLRALRTILNCSSQAPVVVTGPFGTGKTRLLARATYEILKSSQNTVLICAHHQASVDTFVEILGKTKYKHKIMRVIPNNSYHSNIRDNYEYMFKSKYELPHSLEQSGIRIVITTHGTSKLRKNYNFSHILIDEGAQSREPEVIGPLRFARKWTKIIIAGDHLQVYTRFLLSS